MNPNKKPLAYVRVIDKIYLPEEFDKRKKLSANEKSLIRSLYYSKNYNHTFRSLANLFSVSASTIQQTVNEKARQQALLAAQKYRHSSLFKKKPYDSMDIRRRKRELIIKGVIKIT